MDMLRVKTQFDASQVTDLLTTFQTLRLYSPWSDPTPSHRSRDTVLLQGWVEPFSSTLFKLIPKVGGWVGQTKIDSGPPRVGQLVL